MVGYPIIFPFNIWKPFSGVDVKAILTILWHLEDDFHLLTQNTDQPFNVSLHYIDRKRLYFTHLDVKDDIVVLDAVSVHLL